LAFWKRRKRGREGNKRVVPIARRAPQRRLTRGLKQREKEAGNPLLQEGKTGEKGRKRKKEKHWASTVFVTTKPEGKREQKKRYAWACMLHRQPIGKRRGKTVQSEARMCLLKESAPYEGKKAREREPKKENVR